MGFEEARQVLRERFGHAEFRPGQADILKAVLAGNDILAILPTGSGKSLLYQLPALLLPSLTLVVSPLVSLMRDQVHHLVALGIPAATLHSAAEPYEIAEVLGRLRAGSLKLLYVAPERLDQPAMIAALRAARPQIMAVDEAHCIAHWGHDFRPEYRGLRKAAEAIGIRQIVAVTATAALPTRAEIIDKPVSGAAARFCRLVRASQSIASRRATPPGIAAGRAIPCRTCGSVRHSLLRNAREDRPNSAATAPRRLQCAFLPRRSRWRHAPCASG